MFADAVVAAFDAATAAAIELDAAPDDDDDEAGGNCAASHMTISSNGVM